MRGIYALSRDFPIKVKSFGNECLVYHTGEGKTHRLGGCVAFVLSLFVANKSENLTENEILDAITKDNIGIDVSEIEESINLLINLNLVARVN